MAPNRVLFGKVTTYRHQTKGTSRLSHRESIIYILRNCGLTEIPVKAYARYGQGTHRSKYASPLFISPESPVFPFKPQTGPKAISSSSSLSRGALGPSPGFSAIEEESMPDQNGYVLERQEDLGVRSTAVVSHGVDS